MALLDVGHAGVHATLDRSRRLETIAWTTTLIGREPQQCRSRILIRAMANADVDLGDRSDEAWTLIERAAS